jgi:hypothetical protein
MRRLLFVVSFIVLPAMPTCAQAWLPAAGEGSVAVIYQDMSIQRHLLSTGESVDAGDIYSHNLMLDFTYGVTERVALSLALPYVDARYVGSSPHPRSLLDQDHRYHGAIQDFRASVRYSLKSGNLALTPFANVIIPSHEYAYYGHVAPGRREAELQLGMSAGHAVTAVVPGLFLQGRYSYGFTQRTLSTYHDRSNVDGEIGYFVTPRFRVLALTTAQYTHGGIPLTLDLFRNPDSPLVHHHDQLARSRFVDAGAGVQLSVTRRLDVFGSIMHTVHGYSAHALDRGISIGISWGLGKGGPPDMLGDDAKHVLPKCLCEKGAATP